jgi:ribosomal protein L11 methyltransferase
LLEAGALSVDAADAAQGTSDETPLYAEPGNDSSADWQTSWRTSRLTALFGDDVDASGVIARVARALGAANPKHVVEVVADTDWVRQTQAQFGPTCIGEALWIVPSWCEPIDASAVNIRLDPGLAFGTGSHPTTRLCLRWLTQHLRRGETVLDYGCGSGILAIAAATLGAGRTAGIDVDPQAIAASRANAALNNVDVQFDLPGTPSTRSYDVIVANILANPLCLLAPLLASRVRPGGAIVLSGILEAQADTVAAAYARWFNMAVWGGEDGWVALAGSRGTDHG